MTTDSDATDWPPDWTDWPQDERVNFVVMTHTRSGLLQMITRRAGIEREISDTTRLSVEELAAVALELGEAGP